MNLFRKLAPLALLLILTFGGSAAAHADLLNFSINDPIQIANPGDIVTFHAVIYENQGNFVFLNGDSFSVDNPLPNPDDTGLFNNFPQLFFPYDFYNDVLFTLTLPSNIHPGLYTGSFTIQGGFGENDNDPIAQSQSFNITVPGTASTVPEPSTLLLFGTGFIALAGAARKRKWPTL